MPLYPVFSVAAVVAVVALELLWLRTGIFRQPAYWVAMAIVVAFQVPVDGWMTKRSDPITIYDERVLSGVRFPFDIPIEEFAYGVALVTLGILLWERAGNRHRGQGGDRAGLPGDHPPGDTREGPPGTLTS